MIRISREHLEAAVADGVIGRDQLEPLWQTLREKADSDPRFDLSHIAYYLGALVVIGAMGWFVTAAWDDLGGRGIFLLASAFMAIFVALGAMLRYRNGLRVPGGLLITVAVCTTPLAVYGLQRWAGFWAFDDPGSYRDFHHWIRGGWFVMEVATVAAGLLALCLFRFPFLTAPIAFALWYLSMDLSPIILDLYAEGSSPLELRKLVSVYFGLAMLGVAYSVDRRTREDYAFWLYLFGLLAFWGGLTSLDSDSELGRFLYFSVNLLLLGMAAFLKRVVFALFGGVGVFLYINHLADSVFENSLAFSVVLALTGIGIIFLGVQWQRHARAVEGFLASHLPSWLLRLRPDIRD